MNIDIKPIEGFEQYLIDTKGNVFSLKCGRKLKLKQSYDGHGYLHVSLYKNSKMKNGVVHKLVAKHFVSNPNNYKCVNHIDGNKINNNVDNLEWCTYKYNSEHSIAMGKNNNVFSMFRKLAKKRSKKVVQITPNGSVTYESIQAASRATKICFSTISNCASGKVKSAGGYNWKFSNKNI